MLQSVFSNKSQPLPGLQIDLTIKKSRGCPPPPPLPPSPTKNTHKQFKKQNTRLSLRARGRRFSPATKRSGPQLLLWENRRKVEPKEIPSGLIPRLLVVFMGQLEILVTTLKTQQKKSKQPSFTQGKLSFSLQGISKGTLLSFVN